MSYSVDLAYLDYFKIEAEGIYDNTFIGGRLKAVGFAAGTAFIGGVRTGGRVVTLVIEIAKVIFYSMTSLFTWGHYGNLNRLKDHSKLLALNMTGLVGQPLQVIIHSLAIIIGIISPTVAHRMMQLGTTPLAWITSYENKIWQQYKAPQVYTKVTEALTAKITALFDNRPVMLAIKTMLHEFSYSLDATLVYPLSCTDSFHSFGANPKTLTEEQKKLTPILLLNANYCHQGSFLPLLHALKLSNLKQPVYTINLPPDTLDPAFIASKIAAIKKQYGNKGDFEIDMVGHSMGASLIEEICIEGRIQIRRAITVGMPSILETITRKAKTAVKIIGKKDCFVEEEDMVTPGYLKIRVNTGHLGLLFHPKSLNAMTRLLA